MRCRIFGLVGLALLAQSTPAAPPTVAGLVVHAITREPLPGAIVSTPGAGFQDGSEGDAAFLTDLGGRFAFRTLTPAASLLVTKTGYLDVKAPIPARGRDSIVALTPAASITGRVLDPAGDPVANATVRAALEGETREARARTTRTDDRGRYVLDRLEAGNYVVTAGRRSGDAMQRPHPDPAGASVGSGEERDGIELRVPWMSDADAMSLLGPMAPTRVPAQKAAGTATIGGSVRTAQGRAVAGVIVSAWPSRVAVPSSAEAWSAVTDERGAFVIDRLPAGTYTVASHRPTVGGPMGTTPASSQTPGVRVGDGERRSDVQITLQTGGAIGGVVRDELGAPVRATVTLLAANPSLGLVRFGGSRTTDDRGRYRFADLPSNQYLVMAQRATASPVLAGDSMGNARLVGSTPAFYPGVPAAALATPVSISSGSGIDNIDVTVAYEPVADVILSILTSSPVETLEARQESLQETWAPARASSGTEQTSVTFRHVAAGAWFFRVAATLATSNGTETQWARHEVRTDGVSPYEAALTLEPGARVSGTVLGIASGRQEPVRVMLHAVGTQGAGDHTSAGSLSKDGRFTITVMPGVYVIRTGPILLDRPNLMPRPSWALAKAMRDGRDFLDVPLQLAAAADLSGFVLTTTDRITELSGIVADTTGRRLADVELAIVAADPKYHWPGSPRLRKVLTDSDGTYVVRGLPPGDYRIGPGPRAITGAALIQFPRPLPTLAVTLGDGERKIQNVVVRLSRSGR